MLSAINSPLVAGSASNNMSKKYIEVIRPFHYEGQPLKVGKIIEVSAQFAGEMISANKAKLAEPPQAKEKPAEKPKEKSNAS